MNKNIYRQADSRWAKLPYPGKGYTFGGSGCGACAVLHCIIELDEYKNWTPKNIQPYMKQFATYGNGTTWNGITTALKHYGYEVHYKQSDGMSQIWSALKDSKVKRGVLLFGSNRGPDGTVWTTGGHYVAFVDYKIDNNGKHWFYTKDSGGRHHDGWYCYEKSMKGDVKQVWVCKSTTKDPIKPITKTTYKGSYPANTVSTKTGTKTDIKYWQEFLNWWGGYKLVKDGAFGPKTKSATIDFQKKYGLVKDGIVGKKTIAKAKSVGKSEKH